jgi:glucokinase
LLKYLLERFGHVSVERVCSGLGIPNIYAYLRDIERIPEDTEVSRLIASAKDPTPIITNAGLDPNQPSKLCTTTIETFISILGTETGNLAVKVLATGGIYLAGGIPLHMLSAANGARFMESFKRKGRFSELIERIPVHVILTSAALVGAAAIGLERFNGEVKDVRGA